MSFTKNYAIHQLLEKLEFYWRTNERRLRTVAPKIREPNHHFKTYYEDNSLLIQFIISELVQVHQWICRIKTLNHEPFANTNVCIPILEQLVGSVSPYEHPSRSRWSTGSLTKLKDYSEQFSRNSGHQQEHSANLALAAHQAWLAGLHYIELFYILSHAPEEKINSLMLSLKRAFRSLELRFNQVIRYIPRLMPHYWSNENVTLCLLRKRGELTEIYGLHFLHKRFKYPLKMKELNHLLIQSYQARGFETLLPTIQQIFDLEEGLK